MRGEWPDQIIVSTSARDAKVSYSLNPGVGVRVDLHGVITRSQILGGIIFFTLHDATESIQLIAQKGDFSNDNWKEVRSAEVGSRLRAQGMLGRSKTGEISVLLRDLPVSLPKLPVELLPEWEEHSVNVGTQIFLARLRERARDFYVRAGFLELEPTYLSASWERGGMMPLGVWYQGLGAPVFLAPSPNSQLLKAFIVTGQTKLFSVSRCFTSEYRNDIQSAESLILCARQLPSSLENVQNLAVDSLRSILDDVSTMPRQTRLLQQEWRTRECEWPPLIPWPRTQAPEIQIFRNLIPAGSMLANRPVDVFRLCWPPNLVVAEGYSEVIDIDVSIGSLTLHLERMVPLLRATPMRRLRHLSLVGGDTPDTVRRR